MFTETEALVIRILLWCVVAAPAVIGCAASFWLFKKIGG